MKPMRQWGILMAGVAMMSGCSLTKPSAETQFYLLDAPPLPNQVEVREAPDGWEVEVAPVHIADYLKRKSVVMKQAENQYQVAKLDVWAGSLEEELHLALYKNLVARMPDTRIRMNAGSGGDRVRYRLDVEVYRFDFSPGGEVRLEAGWQWIDGVGRPVVVGRFNEHRAASGSINENIHRMSQLVSRLAEVAAGQLPAR